jgi:hypothetical protein
MDEKTHIIEKIAQIKIEIVRTKAVIGVNKMEIKYLCGNGPKPKYVFSLSATTDKVGRIRELDESIYKAKSRLDDNQKELSELEQKLSEWN